VLLETLGGYTREQLDREPAWVIQRWLIILEERGKAAERERRDARARRGVRRG